jgi:hypothetical protein
MARSSKPRFPAKRLSTKSCSYFAKTMCLSNFDRCSRALLASVMSWALPILTLALIGFAAGEFIRA